MEKAMSRTTKLLLAVLCFSLSFGIAAFMTRPAMAISQANAATLSQEEQDIVSQLSSHINSMTTMQGTFVQIGPDGRQSEGYFVVDRPGKLLFKYKPPVKVEIVADGKALVIRDRKAGTRDVWPIGKTPLRFLLDKNVDLAKDSKVLGVRALEGNKVNIVMEEVTPAGTGRIALTVDQGDYSIERWTVTDPQGLETTIALQDIAYGKPTDPQWFYINHTYRAD